jgi:hypothetical protein
VSNIVHTEPAMDLRPANMAWPNFSWLQHVALPSPHHAYCYIGPTSIILSIAVRRLFHLAARAMDARHSLLVHVYLAHFHLLAIIV